MLAYIADMLAELNVNFVWNLKLVSL